MLGFTDGQSQVTKWLNKQIIHNVLSSVVLVSEIITLFVQFVSKKKKEREKKSMLF